MKKRDLATAIREAAVRGVGMRLSAVECEMLSRMSGAIATLAAHGDAEWRPVPGFERYEVSDRGVVRRGLRILKQTEARSKHMNVTLYDKNSKQWRVGVHHIVALTFQGPAPKERPFACHRNGRAWENGKDNLYWGSRAENTADMLRHRLVRVTQSRRKRGLLDNRAEV